MNKQQLASKIWESANKMRSKIEANEYKDYILGFIFYKFLSDKEVKFLLSQGYQKEELSLVVESDYETVEYVQNNIGYFIDYKNLFSSWIDMSSDFSVENVRVALSAFERLINPSHQKVFKGVFDTLNTGLSKLGDSAASQTNSISELLYLIKDIPMDGKQDYDVLGFVYEYLISNFAANAGKKAGEFYTPHEVSLLMSEIVAFHLKDRNEIKIYDPTSGSGSLLINIGKAIGKYMGDPNKIKYYAQELKENTYNLTRMNLVMRGILPDNIVTRNGDTLEEDWPYFDEQNHEIYDPLYVDAVVSNPPYSQSWIPNDKESDPRYAGYGLAPKTKADYAFLLHDLFHIKSDGIMTIVLPHGVLFRGGEEGEIRKNLIENNHIDAIIGLPEKIFFGTGIPTIIMVLKQKRENSDVLIVDASNGFIKDGKNNKLRACDIKRISDVVVNRASVYKYSRVVSRDEIRENGYNLNIPRYVDSSEKEENWDLYATIFGGIPECEINELSDYWNVFSKLRDVLFTKINTEYCEIKVSDIEKTVRSHDEVNNFISSYCQAFNGFDNYLSKELVQNASYVNLSKAETSLSDDIFNRLKDVDLVDVYEAYQILDNNWTRMSVDLEIIQTEGYQSIKIVDPNMVEKSKNGKKVTVQDGWVGRIIPFELTQKTYFLNELNELKNMENRLNEILSYYESSLDELSEEDKEKDFVNDDRDAFVWKALNKSIKEKSVEPSVLEILKKVSELNKEEKVIKKEIKNKREDLHLRTKYFIEHLEDNQVLELLHEKWITPFVEQLMILPSKYISNFLSKLIYLENKYKTTFDSLYKEINIAENNLSVLLDSLSGSEFDQLGIDELKKLLGGK